MILLAAPVKSFVEANCEFDVKAFVEKDELYSRWKMHCMNNGEQPARRQDVFCRDLLSGYVDKIKASRATVTLPDRTTKFGPTCSTVSGFAPSTRPKMPWGPEQEEFLV